MIAVLEIVDEIWGAADGPRQDRLGDLTLSVDRITARDLIARRVEMEWEARGGEEAPGKRPVPIRLRDLLAGTPATDAGPPGDTGRRLPDVIAAAQTAFEAGRFLMLLGDRQVETLDEMLDIRGTNQVSFIKLTALRGG